MNVVLRVQRNISHAATKIILKKHKDYDGNMYLKNLPSYPK